LKKGDLGGFKNQQAEEIFGKRYKMKKSEFIALSLAKARSWYGRGGFKTRPSRRAAEL
jgi:hypothetical protein